MSPPPRARRAAERGWRGRAGAAVAAWALAGCVVVPVTRDVYDPDCRLMRREVMLEAAMLGQFHSCSGQECSALLATLGVVSAATLVVSGSLAVVGNVVYWLEHEANCRRRNAPQAPVPTPPAAPAAPGTTLGPADRAAAA
ncbi:MAG: hypothetical protein JNJ71_17360 [Rubrivivax sp.]|nr:hypothetical protein [Rubrivivax sp.]